MNRRDAVLALLALGAASAPRIASPQARVVRLGVLSPRQDSVYLPAFLKRLEELGYVEGKNIIIDHRSADGVPERFPSLARDLIRAKNDLIVAVGPVLSVRALLEAKVDVPVVIVTTSYDPVKEGVVTSLRRPGGNITGMFFPVFTLAAKHLELMRETLPKAKRFLVLADPFNKEHLEVVRQAANPLRVEIIVETLAAPRYDVDSAFTKGRAAGAEAVIVLDSPVIFDQRKKIAEFVMKHRLPSIVNPHYFLGGSEFLIGYGPNFATAFTRLGDIVGSILKGVKAGDIPIEQPMHFEMIINRRAAKALGITIPNSVVVRADRTIE